MLGGSRGPRLGAAALLVAAWVGVLGPLHRRSAGLRAALDAEPASGGGDASPVGGDADDGAGVAAVASASVSLPATDSLMPLYATVDVTFAAALVGRTVDVSVEYKPRAATSLPSLWTEAATVADVALGATLGVRLYRLRANAAYVYRAFVRPAGGAAVEACSGHFGLPKEWYGRRSSLSVDGGVRRRPTEVGVGR